MSTNVAPFIVVWLFLWIMVRRRGRVWDYKGGLGLFSFLLFYSGWWVVLVTLNDLTYNFVCIGACVCGSR